MAPSPRFLLPVSLLILFLALVAVEAEAPLSNKRTLQTEDESEGNDIDSESLESFDSDSSPNFAGEDAGDEEIDDMEEEGVDEDEDEDDESPFRKKVRGL
ncbi:uncharacterized protein [Notamacropus eugenii]|uniref:uncharacterized protein isoform X2 n=1 Tax=Notamacropus eugenii TaxID=9315 RepID=UPI003B67574C